MGGIPRTFGRVRKSEFEQPSTKRRKIERMKQSSLTEVTGILFFLSFALILLGYLGIERFGASSFVKTGFPRIIFHIGGYDGSEFIGIIVSTVALPLGILVFYSASWRSISLFPPTVHALLLALCLGFAWLMYTEWNAKNLIECGFFLCAFWGEKSKRGDTPNGFYQSMCL